MKRFLRYRAPIWFLIITLAGLGIILSVLGAVSVEKDAQSSSFVSVFTLTTVAVLSQFEVMMAQNRPARDSGTSWFVRQGIPSAWGKVIFYRQLAPAWGRNHHFKQSMLRVYFFPLVVFLLFFTFYQASRTSSETEPPLLPV